jgi:hypothetical protein
MLLGTWVTEKGERQSFSDASPAKFEHWRRQSSVIHDVSAFLPGLMNFTGGEVAEQVRSLQASADFFHCWGIRTVRGRTFTHDEDLPNGSRVTLISQTLWTRRFASNPYILGKTISLNGEPYAVIGILADSPGNPSPCCDRAPPYSRPRGLGHRPSPRLFPLLSEASSRPEVRELYRHAISRLKGSGSPMTPADFGFVFSKCHLSRRLAHECVNCGPGFVFSKCPFFNGPRREKCVLCVNSPSLGSFIQKRPGLLP